MEMLIDLNLHNLVKFAYITGFKRPSLYRLAETH